MSVKSNAESDSKRFASLMKELREGSDEAAWKLLEEYGPHIKAVVRKSLGTRLRVLYDSTDFVQSVWASLLRADHDFVNVKNPRNFILAVARNKVVDEMRKRRQSIKHNVDREIPLDSVEESDLGGHSPRPSEWVQAKERWESIMSGQNEVGKEVIRLRIAGHTLEDIAERLDISERTVRRTIKRIVDRHQLDT